LKYGVFTKGKKKMNCEKCKIKKATVFYADSSGGRHSLCASCASELGRLSQYDPQIKDVEPDAPFTPKSLLTSLNSPILDLPIYCDTEAAHTSVCQFCATPLSSIVSGGKAGCPMCYSEFGSALFPSSLSIDRANGARMPSAYRASVDRTRSVAELKVKLRIAVESESYELAAELRDKIKMLESIK
jgi:protein arginine kinase activator